MRNRAARAIEDCRKIASMSEELGRTMRRFLSPPVRDVHAHLQRRMDALCMTSTVDAVGNLRGLWKPPASGEKRLLLGSHIDTVPDAGAFDGVLGVILALEWVQLAQELALPIAIEVIAFSEEEGVRFGVPFIGSRAVAGRFDPALLNLTDSKGVTLDGAIREFGLDPKRIPYAAADDSAAAFVEIHIEQGPVLESENQSLAAVTSVVGQTRILIEFTGQANHAGTTPMTYRRDALTASAEWISAVEKLAKNTPDLVATVGKLSVNPNAGNVIPGSVELSLDVRHARDGVRRAAVTELLNIAQSIAERRGISVQWITKMDDPAVPMDERLTSYLADAMEVSGFPVKMMPSGAGHDAMVMAARMPTAMLFLRSPGGISHNPAETAREEDVEAALHVGQRFLERLAAKVG
jgi:allantoate deiminase